MSYTKRPLNYLYIFMLLFAFCTICYATENELTDNIAFYDVTTQYVSGSGISTEVDSNGIYTGKGYLKLIKENGIFAYYSSDGKEWKNITNESNKSIFSLYGLPKDKPLTCRAIETDHYIIIFGQGMLPYGQTYSREGNIYILDSVSYSVIKSCHFDNPIAQVSYVDGICYVTLYTKFATDNDRDIPRIKYTFATSKETLFTEDFETWNIYSLDGKIPISNTKQSIIVNNSLIYPYIEGDYIGSKNLRTDNIYICNSEQSNDEVVYEKIRIAQLLTIRDIFVAIPETDYENSSGKFYVSNDGIYFSPVELEDKNQMLCAINDAGTDKLICAVNSYVDPYISYKYYYCYYNDLKKILNEDNIYIKLAGKILSFNQIPIIESDRTLVPMRFLFEQMGADVEWDGSVQAATATLNDTAVTFAINDTEAEVNNTPVSMDVPARLINGKTMVPLRFLSENLGYTVTWDEATRTAIIE